MSVISVLKDFLFGEDAQTPEQIKLLDFVSIASFKEIPFLLEKSMIYGGRKDVLHRYVNSNNQIVEDLGLQRRSVSFDAIVGGDGYFANRDRLLSALEEGGSGTLVHPFYGAMENMVARKFTINEDFKEFGIAYFTIDFDYSAPISSTPFEEANTLSQVAKAAEDALNKIESSLANGIKKPKKPSVFDKMKAGVTKVTGALSTASKSLNGVVSEINSFNDQLTTMSGSLVDLIFAPALLASSLKGLFSTITGIFEAPKQALDAMLGMFGIGDDDKARKLNFNTTTRNEINNNDYVLFTSTNAMALIQAYDSLANAEFSTIEELEYYEALVEAQYEIISASAVIDTEAKTAITRLRTVASKVINSTKTKLPNVIDITVNTKTPLRAIEFQYYGENTITDKLRLVNENPNECFLVNEVRIINNVVN